MDDDDVDLNQDWFFDAAEQKSSPTQQNGGRGGAEYSTLNVPLDDDYPPNQMQQQMYASTSTQQIAYHSQQQYDDQMPPQSIPQQQTQMRVQQIPMQQQRQQQMYQQGTSENYNYSNQPQQQQQQYQMSRSQPQQQQNQDWDTMQQQRPGSSQMIQRPNSQMMQRPESGMQMQNYQQLNNQGQSQYYQDQSFENMPQGSNDQYGMPQQMQGNRVVYKSQQMNYSSNSNPQYASTSDGNYISGGQQNAIYVQQSYQSNNQGSNQRLSGGGMPQQQIDPQMDMMQMPSQMQPVDSTQLAYNQITPPSSKKPIPQQRSQQPVTGNQRPRKGPPVQQQMIIQQPPMQQQPMQVQMQDQYVTQIQAPPPQQQAPPPKTRRKPPAKKAPTLADIMNRFTQIGAVSFETTEQNNEFVSILMTLQGNPNATAEERMNLSERLDKLLGEADVSQKPIAPAQPPPKPSSRNRKKPPAQPHPQQIETQPPDYMPQQPQVFANQPGPQMSNNTRTIIVDYNQAGPSYTQIPMQQTQPYTIVNDPNQPIPSAEPLKKPPRRRPPKKTAAQQQQPQVTTIQADSIPATVMSGGQQIIICAQPGTSTMQNAPVILNYGEALYTTPGGGQQIYLQYQPVPAAQIPQPIVESPKEISTKIENAKTSRQNKVKKFFDDLYDRLEDTDYITPFKDTADVVDRLLPFAFNYEPDYSEEYLEKVDDEMLRRFVHLDNRIKKMGEKLQKVYIEESITHREQDYEVNMLLYLDSEYERRRLEQDKLDAKKDLDDFLRDSDIIRAGVDLAEVEMKKQLLKAPEDLVDPHTSSYGTYEYNEFDENTFTHVEVTPPPSPPKPSIKTKKKREKSKYLYASDFDSDSEEEEEDEDEEKSSDSEIKKRVKKASITELIDLSATIDMESDNMDQTLDAETLAAHEQTEAIDKALELLPHDLENVIPSIFDDISEPKGLPFDLPLNLQQSNVNFMPNVTSAPQTSSSSIEMIPPIPISMPMSLNNPLTSSSSFGLLNTSVSSIHSTIQSNTTHSTVQSNTVQSNTIQSNFNFVSMKTPPNQQIDFNFQKQQQLNFPISTSSTISQIQKGIFTSATQQNFPRSPPKPQQKQQPESSISHFNKQIPKEVIPIVPPPQFNQLNQQQISQQPSIMKPPPIIKPPTTNNNKEEVLAPKIPKFKPINSAKNPLNDPTFKPPVQPTTSSILKPPTKIDQPIEKLPPKPLEPPGAFDAPHIVHNYQPTPIINPLVQPSSLQQQPSLKQRLLQQKNTLPLDVNMQLLRQVKADQLKAEQLRFEQLKAEQLKTEQLMAEQLKAEQLRVEKLKMNQILPPAQLEVPKLTTTQVNRTELAAVSTYERERLMNTMKQRLQEKKSEKMQLDSQKDLSKQNKRPTKSISGMEDSDDEGSQPKRPKTHQLSVNVNPPKDATPSHTSAICRPSPTAVPSLPIRLRFKVGHNQPNSSGNDQIPPNLQNEPPTSAPNLPSTNQQNHLSNFDELKKKGLMLNKMNEDEEELKRQRKAEKKQRKEEKKKEKKRLKEEKRHKEEEKAVVEEVKPLKLKIKFGGAKTEKEEVVKKPEIVKKEEVVKKEEEPKVEKLKLSFKLKKPEVEPMPEVKQKIEMPKHESKTEKKSKEERKKLKEEKKSRKRSSNEAPPKLVAQQEVSEPKVPRLKIKFGGSNNEPSTSVPKKEDRKEKFKESKKEESKMKREKEPKLKLNLGAIGLPRKSSVATPPTLPVSESPKKAPTIPMPSFNLKPVSTLPKPTSAFFGNFINQQLPPSLPFINPSTLNPPIVAKRNDLEPYKNVVPKIGTAEPQFSDDEMDDPESELLKKQTSQLASSLTKLR